MQCQKMQCKNTARIINVTTSKATATSATATSATRNTGTLK